MTVYVSVVPAEPGTRVIRTKPEARMVILGELVVAWRVTTSESPAGAVSEEVSLETDTVPVNCWGKAEDVAAILQSDGRVETDVLSFDSFELYQQACLAGWTSLDPV
jgi:hypothetical protein